MQSFWICLIRHLDASSSDYQLKYEVELCSLVLARLPSVFWHGCQELGAFGNLADGLSPSKALHLVSPARTVTS
jgi:hypothetical protein